MTHVLVNTITEGNLHFPTVADFAQWMEANHTEVDEVWVALPKKGTDVGSLTRGEALDVALCYGWIDGKAYSGDVPEGWWAQRFSPRRKRSPWSKINCARVRELIAEGRMRPPGQEQIDLAKADGRWDAAYAPQSEAVVTPELQAALDASPAASAAFDRLSRSNRYQILLTLAKAVKPETKTRRIADYIDRLECGDPVIGARKPKS
ncbi:YdeI/OmpD-associated family protein [Actinokineospora pegani]|uniref:YdeI/OmpD-associated family protein n=1 Tax=Actinokineospora pegani TaxID=2654637 RepID=UPI0018D3E00C|nr:YdeI/OmpD-associated family protein [Actinokineospora pegani]